MENGEVFINSFETVFEKVLQLKISEVHSKYQEPVFDGEKPVAALDFNGDMSGQLVMVLKADEIAPILDVILKKFDLQIPIAPIAVFSELLNIYSGNVITTLAPYGKKINITPPREIGDDMPHGRAYVVTLFTEVGYIIKFCFYLNK